MIQFLNRPPEERKLFIDQASTRTAISANAIEKDWWVTLVLKALFDLPMAGHFIFKGGTSLSKGWKLIKRFSEDIDIALAPEAFEKKYVSGPTKTYVKSLKKKGCKYTSTTIKDALQTALSTMGVPEGTIIIEADAIKPEMPDKDPQTIFIHYPSLYESNIYIAPVVKIEFSVRSLKEPFADVAIKSILSEALADSGYEEETFEVTAVEPRKTFLEKAFLLHEKFQLVENAEMIGDRQSRHFSDMVSMMDTTVEAAVWSDPDFYTRLLNHRREYIGHRGVDYQTMQMFNLRFVPPDDMIDLFRRDYNTMLEEMIYADDPPDFERLIDQLRLLNGRFALSGNVAKLDELIRNGIENIKQNDLIQDNRKVETSLVDTAGDTYLLEFIVRDGSLVFNRIVT
jgi:Nucleotidyl transferase AbiEii toxin, Type IV TA system